MLGWSKIERWKQNRGLVQALAFEQAGDYRRALLTIEQIVQLYPKNMEARRRLASFYDRAGDRQALAAWNELTRLEPADPQNAQGLVGSALRFGEWETARSTLLQLRQSSHLGPEYYRLSAGLALGTHDNAALEENLAELARLQPADLRVQLNLAIARVRNPDALRAQAGREALIHLAGSAQLRIRAIVELIDDISRRWPRPTPERAATFQQLVLQLVPAKGPRLDPPEVGDPVERLLAYAMLQPAPEGQDVVVLLNWMVANGRAASAFEWADTLAPQTRSSPMVMAALADGALRTSDWGPLRRLLLAGAWGAVPREGVEQAINFRERRDRESLAVERGDWSKAVEACRTSLLGLQMLLRLSEAWAMPAERRQVLQAVARNFPGETWAWRQLISYALAQENADQLWQTYQGWSRSMPGDRAVQVEAAMMGLLLQRRGAASAATTAELVRQQPENPKAVVAHSLALWRGNHLTEALAQLESLPRPVFAEPRFALVYGLLLAEAGRAAESESMLTRATAERLLPEERSLADQARARNRPRQP